MHAVVGMFLNGRNANTAEGSWVIVYQHLRGIRIQNTESLRSREKLKPVSGVAGTG